MASFYTVISECNVLAMSLHFAAMLAHGCQCEISSSESPSRYSAESEPLNLQGFCMSSVTPMASSMARYINFTPILAAMLSHSATLSPLVPASAASPSCGASVCYNLRRQSVPAWWKWNTQFRVVPGQAGNGNRIARSSRAAGSDCPPRYHLPTSLMQVAEGGGFLLRPT